MTWLSELSKLSLTTPGLGIQSKGSRSWGPCPACGEDKRGKEDPRGPINLVGETGWTCHRGGCDGSGDAADYLSYRLHSARLRDVTPEQREVVRAEAEALGLIARTERLCVTTPSGIRRGGVRPVATPEASRDAMPEAPAGGSGFFRWRETLPGGAALALWAEGEDAEAVQDYLVNVRKIPEEVLRRWEIGAVFRREGGRTVERWVTIPLPDRDGVAVNVKWRSVPGPCLRCGGAGCDRCAEGQVRRAYRACAGRPLPLFGLDRVLAKSKAEGSTSIGSVIVAEGELELLAWETLGWRDCVVSGSAGAGQDWPDAWLDDLESATSLYLALDADTAGDAGAEKIAEKLGRERCVRVRAPNGAKDIGDHLAAGGTTEALAAVLDGASEMCATEVGSPSEFGDELEDLILRPNLLRGIQSSQFELNEALGGFLPGLWAITGESGKGKTTFATWLCWDLATQGVPVLLTSYEQRPIGTIQKLIRMELGGDFTRKTEQERRDALDALDRKQIYLVRRIGDVTYEELKQSILFARRRRGVQVVLVDHLDYVARVRGRGEDEREVKERISRDIHQLGEREGIVILMIVHPNNQASNQRRRVEMGDLKGASAIRQESCGILVVEQLERTQARPHPASRIHVEKVRNEFGKAGSAIGFAFDPLAQVFAQRWEDTPSGAAGIRVVAP